MAGLPAALSAEPVDPDDRGSSYKFGHLGRLARRVSLFVAHPVTFLAVGILLGALFVGWGFVGVQSSWQFPVGTFLTVVAFFLLFVIQNTQDRETTAIHLKLNELIRSHEGAHNSLLDIEHLTDRDLRQIDAAYERIARRARKDLAQGMTWAATGVVEVSTLDGLVSVSAAVQDERRLAALEELGQLDCPPDDTLDRLSVIAKTVTGAPVALVSLVSANRQHFRSCIGLPEPWNSDRGTPLTHSFCQYVVASNAPLIIEDAREDLTLKDNAAITDLGVVAYCGIPLRNRNQPIGSFCVIDTDPRPWSAQEVEVVRQLAAVVEAELILRAAVRSANTVGDLFPTENN